MGKKKKKTGFKMPNSVRPPDDVVVIVPDDQIRFVHRGKEELFDPEKLGDFEMDDDDYEAAAAACAHIQSLYPSGGSETFDFGIDVDDPLLDEIEMEAGEEEAGEDHWESAVQTAGGKRAAGRYIKKRGTRHGE